MIIKSFEQGTSRTWNFQSGRKKIEGGYDKLTSSWVMSEKMMSDGSLTLLLQGHWALDETSRWYVKVKPKEVFFLVSCNYAMELPARSRVYTDLKSSKTGYWYYPLRAIKLIVLSQKATETDTHWRLGKCAWKNHCVFALVLYALLHMHDGPLLESGDTGQVKCLLWPSVTFLILSLTNVSVKTTVKMRTCMNLYVASEMERWLCFFYVCFNLT